MESLIRLTVALGMTIEDDEESSRAVGLAIDFKSNISNIIEKFGDIVHMVAGKERQTEWSKHYVDEKIEDIITLVEKQIDIKNELGKYVSQSYDLTLLKDETKYIIQAAFTFIAEIKKAQPERLTVLKSLISDHRSHFVKGNLHVTEDIKVYYDRIAVKYPGVLASPLD